VTLVTGSVREHKRVCVCVCGCVCVCVCVEESEAVLCVFVVNCADGWTDRRGECLSVCVCVCVCVHFFALAFERFAHFNKRGGIFI